MRRILEVGPGLNPLHHRDEVGALKLDPDEIYTALDLPTKPGMGLKNQFWQDVKNDYPGRVFLVQGTRESLPIGDATQDEIVFLGTQSHNIENQVAEIDRVLKQGGIARMGGMESSEILVAITQRLIQQMGYELLPEETKKYNYKDVRIANIKRQIARGASTDDRLKQSQESPDSPYIVLAYRKPIKN